MLWFYHIYKWEFYGNKPTWTKTIDLKIHISGSRQKLENYGNNSLAQLKIMIFDFSWAQFFIEMKIEKMSWCGKKGKKHNVRNNSLI